jgi:hypothetical protein
MVKKIVGITIKVAIQVHLRDQNMSLNNQDVKWRAFIDQKNEINMKNPRFFEGFF